MSDASAREAFAGRPDTDKLALAEDICACLGLAPIFALCRDTAWAENGFPVALCGCGPTGSDTAAMLWIATDDWPRLWLATRRWWVRTFVPEVLARFRRVEFLAGADEASRRWCRSVGFTGGELVYRHGRNGEDFVRFSWENPNWRAAQ